MSEADFVMAWLLAMRAGSSEFSLGRIQVASNIDQAKEIYKKLMEESDETNS
jgi:hypothetical protein